MAKRTPPSTTPTATTPTALTAIGNHRSPALVRHNTTSHAADPTWCTRTSAGHIPGFRSERNAVTGTADCSSTSRSCSATVELSDRAPGNLELIRLRAEGPRG